MSEDKNKEARDAILAEFGDEEEKDVIFQAQMKVYDLFMNHWKKLIAISGVFLACVLVYGKWQDHKIDQQRDNHQKIFGVKQQLPNKNKGLEQELVAEIQQSAVIQRPPTILILDQFNPPLRLVQPNPLERAKLYANMNLAPNLFEKAEKKNNQERIAQLRVSAQEMQSVAETSKGIAAFYAWFEAADLWRRVDEPRSQLEALQNAQQHAQGGITAWSVVANMASAHTALGEHDKSIALFREYADQNTGLYVEYSLYNLALLYEEKADIEGAKSALSELFEKAPESKLSAEAKEMRIRLGS